MALYEFFPIADAVLPEPNLAGDLLANFGLVQPEEMVCGDQSREC
jgi:hypothetical protein